MHVYFVLDSAKTGNIRNQIDALSAEYRSLYRTLDSSENQSFKEEPYLFTWPGSDAFSQFILGNGKEQSWGIFITPSCDFETLYKHLRRFLVVKVEGMINPVQFRFYDPRVLALFLPTCTTKELSDFFGPIDALLAEDTDLTYLNHYSLKNGKLQAPKVLVEDFWNGNMPLISATLIEPPNFLNNQQEKLHQNVSLASQPTSNETKSSIGKSNWKLFD